MLQFAPKSSYSRDEVLRLLEVSERQLRGWERHRLIQPSETFAFTDLIALRTLRQLRNDRVPAQRILAALSALRRHLRDIRDPLRELKIVSRGRRISVEVAGQHMDAVSGQLLFDFNRKELTRLLSFPAAGKADPRARREDADKWFQRGLESEQKGMVKDAIKAYEAAVELDPSSAGAWLNLGTIFFNARQLSRAETYYKRSLEADPDYALAHFNIANLYDERGDRRRALTHYEHAVRLSPNYADAHYNLALLLQASGKVMDAVRHWKLYLKLDPGSSWGSIARRELDKLRKSALVPTARHSGSKIASSTAD